MQLLLLLCVYNYSIVFSSRYDKSYPLYCHVELAELLLLIRINSYICTTLLPMVPYQFLRQCDLILQGLILWRQVSAPELPTKRILIEVIFYARDQKFESTTTPFITRFDDIPGH